jgi:hypothetical protein
LNLISKPTIEKEPSRFNAVGAPSAKSVLSLAFNNRCDVIVATVVAGDEPVAQEQAVLEFVNCDLAAQGSSDIRALVQPPPVNRPEVGAELLSNSPEGHSRSIRNAGESTAAFATALRAGLGQLRHP